MEAAVLTLCAGAAAVCVFWAAKDERSRMPMTGAQRSEMVTARHYVMKPNPLKQKGNRNDVWVAVEKPFLAMAVFTTLHGENSLNRHGRGDILGVLRLVLTPPSRGSDSLRMTTGKSVQ